MEHTKEPWQFLRRGEYGRTSGVQRGNEGGFLLQGSSREQEDADARRIVACVNACIGVSTEDLHAWAREEGFQGVIPIHHAAKQRDRLLEALKGLLEYPSGQYSEDDGFDKACERANAAIAAVEAAK